MKPYYEDEYCRLYLGDCREVLPTLEPVTAIVTDPPYGLGDKMQGGTWGITRKQEMTWDKKTPSAFVLSLLEHADKVCIWGGNYYPLPPSRGWLAWYKPDAPQTMAQVELAWTNQDRNAKQIIHSIAATNGERCGHPTQKPLRVMKWCISELQIKDGVILDPFCGSGTTLRAAKDLGIKSIGIELSEEYCEIAARRLSQGVLCFEEAV